MYPPSTMASIIKREWTTQTGEQRLAWRVKFNVGKRTVFRQFKTERKAKKFLETVDQERKRLEAKGVALDSPPFSEVAEAWLAARTSGSDGLPPLEPATARWYRGLLTHHILPRLGRFRVGELRRADLKAFRAELLTSGASVSVTNCAHHHSQQVPGPKSVVQSTKSQHHYNDGVSEHTRLKLSRRTVAKIVTTCRQILGYAMEEELIDRDPSERVTVRHSSRDRPEIQIHTVEEMRSILQTAKELSASRNKAVAKTWQRYHPMLLILVYCGLRISEVRGLDCKDVDFDRGVIRVRQRADNRGVLGAPKSAKGNRQVHFPRSIEEILRREVEAKEGGLLFTTRSGKPVDAANFRKRAWEQVQAAAGVRVLTLHSCRHFFASRQIEHGVHPKELSALMGHADESFTLKVYGHLFKDGASESRRRQVADALVL